MKNTINVNGKRIVCKIWDNEGKTFDRFTVVLKAFHDKADKRLHWPVLGSSAHPFHPQGFGQYMVYDTPVGGNHLGKRISFDNCPFDVQKFILQTVKN